MSQFNERLHLIRTSFWFFLLTIGIVIVVGRNLVSIIGEVPVRVKKESNERKTYFNNATLPQVSEGANLGFLSLGTSSNGSEDQSSIQIFNFYNLVNASDVRWYSVPFYHGADIRKLKEVLIAMKCTSSIKRLHFVIRDRHSNYVVVLLPKIIPDKWNDYSLSTQVWAEHGLDLGKISSIDIVLLNDYVSGGDGSISIRGLYNGQEREPITTSLMHDGEEDLIWSEASWHCSSQSAFVFTKDDPHGKVLYTQKWIITDIKDNEGSHWLAASFDGLGIDLSRNSRVRIALKASDNIRQSLIQFKDNQNRVATVKVANLSAHWKATDIPISSFQDKNIDLSKIKQLVFIVSDPSSLKAGQGILNISGLYHIRECDFPIYARPHTAKDSPTFFKKALEPVAYTSSNASLDVQKNDTDLFINKERSYELHCSLGSRKEFAAAHFPLREAGILYEKDALSFVVQRTDAAESRIKVKISDADSHTAVFTILGISTAPCFIEIPTTSMKRSGVNTHAIMSVTILLEQESTQRRIGKYFIYGIRHAGFAI